MNNKMGNYKNIPLVVDLDGTLTPSDIFVELFFKLVRQKPIILFFIIFWLIRGRAYVKARVASLIAFDPKALMYRTELCAFLKNEKNNGRFIVLATAADRKIAEAVAGHLELFNEIIASDHLKNVKGKCKLEAIHRCLGKEFIYAGDSYVDLPIWKEAAAAIVVAAPKYLVDRVRQHTPIIMEIPTPSRDLWTWLKQLRVHQWLKNLLIFVPLLSSFEVPNITMLMKTGLAFLAFSLVASATYVLNDLWDLEQDRKHPRKCRRPLASGQLSIVSVIVVAVTILFCGILLAIGVNRSFATMLVLYIIATLTYSWKLKSYVLIDVVMLSALYTLRIFAGAAAIMIIPSVWLLAFSVFLFFSLALVKRCAELMSLQYDDMTMTSGRDYNIKDLQILWPMGVGTGLCAVLVFVFFATSPDTASRYASPQLLWLVGVGLMCWLGRLWIKTGRGEMSDDPLVYAIYDRGGRLIIAFMLVTTIIAHLIPLGKTD